MLSGSSGGIPELPPVTIATLPSKSGIWSTAQVVGLVENLIWDLILPSETIIVRIECDC